MSLSANTVVDSKFQNDRSSERRIDVTDLDARSVQEYVRDCVTTDFVSFENRGHRTYLIVESGSA